MKKLISLLLALGMIFSITSCSTQGDLGESVSSENEQSQTLNNSLNQEESTETADVGEGTFTITKEFDKTIYEFHHPELENILYDRDGDINIYYMVEGDGDGNYTFSNGSGKYYSASTNVSAHYEEDDDEFWAIYQDEADEYHFPDYSFEDNTITWIFTVPNYEPSEYDFMLINLSAGEDLFYYEGHFEFSNKVRENEGYVIEWVDPLMEQAIRHAINIPEGDIWSSDALDVKELSLQEGLEFASPTEFVEVEIHDGEHSHVVDEIVETVDISLEDLRHFTNLTRLDFGGMGKHSISDLSPLAELKNLERLSITYGGGEMGENKDTAKIGDISPIAELDKLEVLYLENIKLTDLSALDGLDNLIRLSLGENLISDLTPISNLPNLIDLSIYDNKITDLSPLSTLPKLQYLLIGQNELSDLSPLSAITSLTSLGMYETNVTSLTPLSSLENLESLNLSDLELQNLNGLEECTALRSLYIEALPNLNDISALGKLQNLEIVCLKSTSVTDISALANHPNLNDVAILGAPIADLRPLAHIKDEATIYIDAIDPANGYEVTIFDLESLKAWLVVLHG